MNNKTTLNILKCDIAEPRKGDFLKLLAATKASSAINLQVFVFGKTAIPALWVLASHHLSKFQFKF